jgi:Fe-S-cluster containining protein
MSPSFRHGGTGMTQDNMISQLKQFVPSSVCLKCEGCCRFQLADSPWRPKAGQQEITEGLDAAGYLKTIPQDNHYQCVYFNKVDSTCGVYSKRPFECAVYPFVISQSAQGFKVYMHLACPHIQDKETSQELKEYVAYLRDFFNYPSTLEFLKKNNRLLHDYSEFEPELKLLFKVEV